MCFLLLGGSILLPGYERAWMMQQVAASYLSLARRGPAAPQAPHFAHACSSTPQAVHLHSTLVVAAHCATLRCPAEKYLREVWPAVTKTLKEHGIGCELNLVEGSMTVGGPWGFGGGPGQQGRVVVARRAACVTANHRELFTYTAAEAPGTAKQLAAAPALCC